MAAKARFTCGYAARVDSLGSEWMNRGKRVGLKGAAPYRRHEVGGPQGDLRSIPGTTLLAALHKFVVAFSGTADMPQPQGGFKSAACDPSLP
jgi:hypothetical protein